MRLMRDLVGETLSNRYRLVARIAGGGMGEVYRGQDLLLDRTIAVKVLQPNLASDPALVARFKAEARAAARLTHPNVVGVYDWGSQDESTYYMVMEYVPGTDLRDVLVNRGSVDVSQAIEIVTAVCDALAAAHAGGLVHRDVKPENVLVSRSGAMKVADFGIAAVTGLDRTQPGGMVSGTLRYLSPEQAAGGDASTSSDLWAAGALLSELVTGMPPLQGAGADLLRRRATEPPIPPSALSSQVPPSVDAIVTKACAVDPAERYETAVEMRAALQRVAGELGAPAPLDQLLDEVTGEIRLDDSEPTEFAPRRVHRTRPKRSRSIAFAVLAALILLGGARGVAALLAPQQIEVPSLIGLQAQKASTRTEGLGLKAEVVARVHDFSAPPGTVLAQEPEGGLLTEGEAVELTVSTGPPALPVPTVLGMTLDVATVRLRTHQLEVGQVTQRFDEAVEGTVVAQEPPDGKLRWGEKVDLVISKGPQSVGVPDVVGMLVAEAKQTLLQAGFKVIVTDVYSDKFAEGKVVGTIPVVGAEAPEGSTIEIQKSVGPEFKELVMPDVRNMSVAAAKDKLFGMGLRVTVQEVTGDCGDSGSVVDTDPLPGTKIRENDRVALFVVC
jgi:serine/threonine-protein kinase